MFKLLRNNLCVVIINIVKTISIKRRKVDPPGHKVKAVHYFSGEGDLPDGICKTPEELAELIEDAIYRVHRGTTPKYKNQVGSAS